MCASQTFFRPRRGVFVFLSFLCNTRSTEGKQNEETYGEAAEGSHGQLLCMEMSRRAASVVRQSYQIPEQPNIHVPSTGNGRFFDLGLFGVKKIAHRIYRF